MIFSNSCLNDDVIQIVDYEISETARLIKYVESKGDFPNSPEAPGLKSANELLTEIDNYWVLDIRTNEEFIQGHISSAINIRPRSLKNIADSLNQLSNNKRIILVCENGQESAYYCCLLRIFGNVNVYSLKYGMASWNVDFANEWLDVLGTSGLITLFTNTNFPKNRFSSLPVNTFNPSLQTIEEKIEYNLDKLLDEGFTESSVFYRTLGTNTVQNNFLVCYGEGRLYFAPRDVPLGELGHPENTVWFRTDPTYDLRSIQFLQTLPSDTSIIIYSSDGQLSSCIVAYLRFLGYDAKTLLYGANQLFYPRMIGDPELISDAFSQEDIMNYPYVTGN